MKSLLIAVIKSATTYVVIALLAALIVATKSMQLTYSNFSLTTPSGKVSETAFPFFISSNESGVYTLHGTAEMGRFSSSVVRIIPDDEILALAVNKMPVNLQMVPYDDRRNYTKGFVYDLKPYLHQGTNEIDIVYSDGGGMMGIVMSSVPDASATKFITILFTAICLFILYQILSKTSLSKSFQILMLGALLIRLIYFSVTPPDVRGHDVGAHMGYVEHLAAHWVPPPLEQAGSGAFFHPPLYYYSAAVVYKLSQFVEPYNKVALYRVQQLLSLVYSMGFVFFGLLIIERLMAMYRTTENIHEFKWLSLEYWCTATKTNGLFWLMGALFVFWPVNIIHSIRIGNDPLLYLLINASLYYTFRWYLEDKKSDLFIASVLGAGGIITKANGEIIIAVIGIVGLYKMIKTREWKTYFKLAIVPGILLSVAALIAVMPGLLLKLQHKRDFLYFQDLNGVSTANIVGNTAANVLWFDAKIFITEPFTDPYDDRMGRQYFWNYLGKTGIVGEFRYDGLTCINTTIICSFLAIWMTVYIFFGLYYMPKEHFRRQAPILLSGFFLWASVTYMRMTFPVNIDFRYIQPILVTFCTLYAASILTFQARGSTRLVSIGILMPILFTLSGIIFILAIK